MRAVFLLFLVSVLGVVSNNSGYANDTVRIVVGFTPGGGSDRIAREAQQVLQSAGRNTIIDYRPGAGGDLAAREVANSRDSQTTLLLVTTINLTVRNLRTHDVYRLRDLQPVIYLGHVPVVLVTSKTTGIKNFDNFVKDSRTLTFGSSGIGSGTHLNGELIFSAARKTMLHVPYRGNSQLMPDLIAGRIDSSVIFPIQARGLVDQGDINAVAILGSRRIDFLPGVPTLDELGFADQYRKLRHVFFASPGTSSGQIQELVQIFSRTFSNNHIAVRFRQNADMQIEPHNLQNLPRIMQEEFTVYRRLAARIPEILNSD